MSLKIIEHQNQRVLTTAQLAESYGTNSRRISENFNANKLRYQEGKHFILLQGDQLKEFGERYGNYVSVERVSKLYLWTEKGAWMQAKSLNTDQAWDAYETLVDDYYRVKEQSLSLQGLSPQLQLLIQMEQRQNQLEQRLDTLTTGLTSVPDHTKVVERVNEYARWTRIGHNEVYNKIYDILQARHGIDVRQRVENERHKVNMEYFKRTGKYYAESTLKNKVNGIDVMVRMGVLNLFNEILVGLLTKEKAS